MQISEIDSQLTKEKLRMSLYDEIQEECKVASVNTMC